MFRTLALVALLSLTAFAAEPPCHPTTDKDQQERTKLKHRAQSSDSPSNLTVAQMLKWGFPDAVDETSTRTSESTIDPRESKAYRLSGRIWRIAREANDCDYHLEIGSANSTSSSDRVIVEIPQEDHDARKAFLDLLPDKIAKAVEKAKDGKDFKRDVPTGPKITVTGLAFYDGYHYQKNWQSGTSKNCHFNKAQRHQRGHNHGSCAVGTIWELHPVWDVVAE